MRTAVAIVFLWLSAAPWIAVSASEATLMPPEDAMRMLHQCSRETPSADGTWPVSPGVISRLENDLPRLAALRKADRPSPWNPLTYDRQYAGITIHGRKYVYINAFIPFPAVRAVNHDRTTVPVMACDGGDGFWGALYDPQSREFSQLAFNGVA